MSTDPQEMIRARFRTRVPSKETQAAIEFTRHQIENMAGWLAVAAPDGREKSLALTALEEASMWATKAILAREDK